MQALTSHSDLQELAKVYRPAGTDSPLPAAILH
jgi:hypothetical protein